MTKDRLLRVAVALAGLSIFLAPVDLGIRIVWTVMSIACLGFCVLYVLRSNWTATKVGRDLLWCALTLGLWTSHVMLGLWFGMQYPGFLTVQLFLLYLANLAIFNMAVTLVRIQNNTRTRKELSGEPEYQ